MSFSFELNHTLTELQLLLQIDESDGSFLPFQKISIGNQIPIISLDFQLNRNIRIATWNHILSNEMIPFHQIDDNLFTKGYTRCVVPIDGFFYEDILRNKSHYYEINKSLIFAVAISDPNNNFDFVTVENENQFMPISPLFIALNDIDLWLGSLWNQLFENRKSNIILDFMQFFDNTENGEPNPICFQHLFYEIPNSRMKLYQKLKRITPKINQVL